MASKNSEASTSTPLGPDNVTQEPSVSIVADLKDSPHFQLLEHEVTVFADLQAEDGLVITGKGLGVERLLLSFIRIYCDPTFLVLVLNTTNEEEEFFMDELEACNVPQQPKIITNEVGTNERVSVYMKGGVLFVTSRILVVDILTERLPTHLVTGIIVYRAHKIVESGQEAFILRMYRQKNKTGFIKAFSDSPTSFTSGFFQVERVMRNLFVRKLFLWPRFHASVADALEKNKPDVVELHVDLTPLMTSIQMAVLDLLGCCLRELRKSYQSLDPDEMTVENCIGKNFDKFLRSQLDPVWHQLSSRTKNLVSDLKVLRTLLVHLTQYDAVTFYAFLESLRASEKNSTNPSLWLFLDAANNLFVNARARIFGITKKNEGPGSKRSTERPSEIEESPKWKVLSEILEEIKSSSATAGIEGPTLVVANDERTCNQLKEYISGGGKRLLDKIYERTFGKKDDEGPPIAKNGRFGKKRPEKNSSEQSEKFQLKILPDTYTIIHPLRGNSDPYSLMKTLTEMEPRYIVMYDAGMEFVRQVEVYAASRPGVQLRVYFIIYSDSVEEQRYLTTLREEKEAFEMLIRQKAAMVVPEERDGKSDIASELLRDSSKAADAVSSRKAGGRKDDKPLQRKIIVDMREFRSELPSLIHKRGIDIEPVTLEVGDYILSPDMCVERKSLSDLIGSLNSGRLYNQALAMTRFYNRPILLIEFDQNKSFSLQSKSSLGNELSIQNVTSKLALLTLHFPKLRIIWTQSPYATAEIFEDLKSNYPDPDSETAMALGLDSDEVASNLKYNIRSQDFLCKMAGINSKNYR
ncbi:DNA repair endonuclease XPF-like isoform X2 [Rhopilema esculentum]